MLRHLRVFRVVVAVSCVVPVSAVSFAHNPRPFCLGYLYADKKYEADTRSDLKARETAIKAISGLPFDKDRGRWKKYVSARAESRRMHEESMLAHKEEERAVRRGEAADGLSAASLKASKESIDARSISIDAMTKWNDWVKKRLPNGAVFELMSRYIDAYSRTHEYSGFYDAGLVFQAALHERDTYCPPSVANLRAAPG